MTAIAKSAGTAKTERLGPQDASAVPERQSPILTAIDRLITDQETRHAWLLKAGEQARKMNADSKGDAQ